MLYSTLVPQIFIEHLLRVRHRARSSDFRNEGIVCSCYKSISYHIITSFKTNSGGDSLLKHFSSFSSYPKFQTASLTSKATHTHTHTHKINTLPIHSAVTINTVKGLKLYPTCKLSSWPVLLSCVLGEDLGLPNHRQKTLLLMAEAIVRASASPWADSPSLNPHTVTQRRTEGTCRHRGSHYRREALSLGNLDFL